MRSAECKGERRKGERPPPPIPHSAFQIPHWGGVLARTSPVSDPHRPLLHLGRELARGGRGLVRVPWLRAAGGPLPPPLRAAGGRQAAGRRAAVAVGLLT